MNERDSIIDRLARCLAAGGLDLIQPFDASLYNDAVEDRPELGRLPLFQRGLDEGGALALLIGNTRAIWGPFTEAYRQSPALQASSDPLDRYVEGVVEACQATACVAIRSALRYGHPCEKPEISLLHAAELSGMARTSPALLAVHPEHGMWFALRAVIVLDLAPPSDEATAPDPCVGCDAPCKPALQHALEQTKATGHPDRAWESWVALRDACPLGHASRYSEEQIRYHHAKERAVLDSGVPLTPASKTG